MIRMILKGVVIGIANIIPGVSGGTMAVSMGIYDKMIHAATHLMSEFKKSMQVLIPIVIGAGIGLVALARVIEIMFDKAPLYLPASMPQTALLPDALDGMQK